MRLLTSALSWFEKDMTEQKLLGIYKKFFSFIGRSKWELHKIGSKYVFMSRD